VATSTSATWLRIAGVGVVALLLVGLAWWALPDGSSDGGSAGSNQASVPVASDGDEPPSSQVLDRIARQIRWRKQARQDAAEWLAESVGRGAEVPCPGLTPEQAAVASEVLEPRTVDGQVQIFRRDRSGQQVVGAGPTLGMLSWGPDRCVFEPLGPVEVQGEVVFEDGEPAADAILEICDQPVTTGSDGRFSAVVTPDRQARLDGDGRLLCVIRATHRDGWQAVAEQRPVDTGLTVVLDVAVDPADVQAMAEQAEQVARMAQEPVSEQAVWLGDALEAGGSPPPEVRAYLRARVEALEAGGSTEDFERALLAVERVEAELLDGME